VLTENKIKEWLMLALALDPINDTEADLEAAELSPEAQKALQAESKRFFPTGDSLPNKQPTFLERVGRPSKYAKPLGRDAFKEGW